MSSKLIAVAVAVVALASIAATPASADVGFRDFSYGTTVTAPTGQKPQSKLWWTSGGQWWGVLWSTSVKAWTIQKFNKSTGTWSSTGVQVDTRRTGSPDVLWDGTTLHVAMALKEGSTQTDARVLVYRFSFNGTAWSSLGAPSLITNKKPETLVLDKDSTGKLWITYTDANATTGKSVYVAHTTTSPTTWGTPYVLPVPGATSLSIDDISAVVAYGNSAGRYVGVMYSNEIDNTLSFARHLDGAGDAAADWQRIVLASGPKLPDDHLNLKALVDDPSGRVFAVVKTSLNDKSPKVATDPLIVLYTINGTTASNATVWRVGDDVTRAILMLDSENKNAHIFGAAPGDAPSVIYTKSAKYDSPTFPAGIGTPFIQLASDLKINNPSSAKQAVNSTSGLLVEAGDDSTRFYVHNFMALPDGTPPDTTIVSGPTGTVTSGTADFAFSATEAGSTFECRLDTATFSPCTSPKQYTALTGGAHTFSVQAKDAAGNTDQTAATRTWTISTTPADTTPPDTTITTGPTGTVTSATADFAFTSTEAGSTFQCDLDGGGFASCASPKSYSLLAAGNHVFSVRAKDAAGNTDQTPASRSWTIASASTALFSDDFESGTLANWQVVTGGGATATAQTATVKTGAFAARFAQTAAAGSLAHARRAFVTPLTDFTITADFNVLQEGAAGGNVPLLRLLDSAGARVVMLYRQNATNGTLHVAQQATRVNTTGLLPLATWRAIELRVIIAGTASTVTLKIDGTQVYTTTTASLGTSAIKNLQIGNDTAAQLGTIAVDNLSVRSGP